MNDKDYYRVALQKTGSKTFRLQGNAGILHFENKVHEGRL